MDKKEKKKTPMSKAKSIYENYPSEESFKTDPNGSYTGVPIDRNEQPVQDADDL